MSDLYDSDFVLWSERQSELLRRLAAGEPVNEPPDWPNIVEEIESLGKSDKRELRSRVATILLHLVKLAASPVTEPRDGWEDTLFEQRGRLRALLKDSPSLRGIISELIAEELPDAREHGARSLSAHGEQPRVDVDSLTFTDDEVLGPWIPADPPSRHACRKG
nr:DUF29 domain-containing protein [uncultured Rhodopila sp.]